MIKDFLCDILYSLIFFFCGWWFGKCWARLKKVEKEIEQDKRAYTNYDKITKNMTFREMAKFLSEITSCDLCPVKKCMGCKNFCENEFENWLLRGSEINENK